LPRSFVIQSLPVRSGTAVSLINNKTHGQFAQLNWDKPNGLPQADLYEAPDPDSAWFTDGPLITAALKYFFSDERVFASLTVGSRIDWSIKGYEVRFELYPDAEFDPATAIGMRFE